MTNPYTYLLGFTAPPLAQKSCGCGPDCNCGPDCACGPNGKCAPACTCGA